jgi:WD40 repeat protein/serine/threonine protein kinase
MLRCIGDYELHGEIASGGMGTVYLARQISLNRIVALKMIRSGKLATPKEIQMFKREAAAAATLDHPNIVPIYDVGEIEGMHYFSMKLIEGGNLADRIMAFAIPGPSSSKGQLKSRHAVIARLLACLARAVHHAHQRGVLHRDLKPTNVLLDEADQPHLTDFGLAKLTETLDVMQSFAVMGTPAYMAPEQAFGNTRPLTIAVDIYSLGAILYELLGGRPPFQGTTAAEILSQVKSREPEPLKQLNPRSDTDLGTIASKCLEKDPETRYPTALALAEDLERYLRGEPIWARPVGPQEKLWRWCRRQPALAGALGALALALVAGLIGILTQWQRAERHASSESAQRVRAEQALSRLSFEKAEGFFDQDRAALGLAHLARLLKTDPTNAIVAARIHSALSLRPFCLPLAPIRHARRIVDLRLSPDEQHVLSASFDGTVRLTELKMGRTVWEIKSSPALRALFTPDGARVLVTTQTGLAQFWDRATGSPVGEPMQHQGPIDAADISRTGDRLATGSRDRTARLWDGRTGRPLSAPLPVGAPVKQVRFSPDGERLVTVCEADDVRSWDIQLWNSSGQAIGAAITNQPAPAAAQFTPDGKLLLVANASFFDPSTGQVLYKLPNSDERTILSARFSADERGLLTASQESIAQLWDWRRLQPLSLPMRHDNPVIDATFGKGGQEIITGSRDATARVWDLEGRPLTEPMRTREPVWTVVLSGDGTRAVTGPHSEEAWIWQVRRRPTMPQFQHERGLLWAAFSRDGRRLVTTSQDRTAKLWDLSSGRLLGAPMLHGDWINHAEFSPDDKFLLTAAQDGLARLWDLSNHVVIRTFAHREYVRMAEFSRDAKMVATASFDHTAQVWDAQTGQRIGASLEHSARVHAIHFSPDGSRVVTAAQRGTVRVWDSATGRPLTPQMLAPPIALNARFTVDGQRIVSVSLDRTARVWDANSGKEILPPVEHSDELAPYSPDFAADGRRVLTAAGNTARVWDIATGRALTEGFAHQGLVRSAWFSPDGRWILSASADKTGRLWDAASGLPVSEPLRHEAAVPNAFFSPDGQTVLTISDDATAKLWRVGDIAGPIPDWLADLAEAVGGLRFNAQNMVETVPPDALLKLRRQLEASPGTDGWTRWGKQFINQ